MPTRRTVLALSVLSPLAAIACSPSAPPQPPQPSPPAPPLPGGGAGGPVGTQSPIDLPVEVPPSSTTPDLVFHYPQEVEVEVVYRPRAGDTGCGTQTREETIEAEIVRPEGAEGSQGSENPYLQRGPDRYELVQFHFHSPSEHIVAGRHRPMEQHLVHVHADDLARGVDGRDGRPQPRRLVVGLFLDGEGPPTDPATPRAQDVVLAVRPQACNGVPISVPRVRLADSLPVDLRSRHYAGSLTTSPYAYEPPIEWHVLTDTVAVDNAALGGFVNRFPDGDNRDPQSLGDRVVDGVGGSRA